MNITIWESLYLGILSVWDIKEKIVPVSPLMAGGTVIVLAAVYTCLRGEALWVTLIGGMVPGACLILLAKLTGQIGVADGMVVMALGAQCGIRECLLLLFYSLILLSVFSVVLLVLRRAKCSTRIPYLPFLLVGLWISRLSVGAGAW